MTPTDATPRVSVVVPAFNEATILAATIEHLTAGLRERGAQFEIVVAENGSTDGTDHIADELAVAHAEVRVEHITTPDYGAALRAGLLAARGTVVVNFDADYYDLDFLDRAAAMVEPPDGPAIVVGSKRAPGADDTRVWARRLVTTVFSTILRVVFGLRLSDTHGMKAMRRAAVVPYAERCRFGRDLFDTELVLRVERAGLATAEIPVRVEELRPARTSIIRRVPRTIVALVRLRLVLWRDRR
ncbi:MAG TPA: glycosyltransferase [Acidimicrobiia bacterium]|nr:glycosyltransferase [Acidimicrobiia bacterium]